MGNRAKVIPDFEIILDRGGWNVHHSKGYVQQPKPFKTRIGAVRNAKRQRQRMEQDVGMRDAWGFRPPQVVSPRKR